MSQKDLIQFVGAMDTDSTPESIGKGFVRGAWDIIWRGPVGNRRPESNVGTTLVPNALLPNTGTHLTIGVYYDAVAKRVFFFNYNSAGRHGIYIYNTVAQPVATFQVLLQSGVNTAGDPLSFTPTGRISSVDILRGDPPIGNLLFYVDSLGRPTQIPIDLFLTTPPNPVTRAMIDLITAPPVMPPQCTYENDYTVNVNNLINGLWQFAAGFFDYNSQKTVISSASKVPLPSQPFDPTQNMPPSNNSRIGVYLPTGDASITKIRIYGRQTKDGATSDWYIIEDLDKAVLGIGDNTVYKYLFYNTGNYIVEDPAFAVLNFDIVPLQANCQVLLDGGTIAFAGIKEGYDYPFSSFNVSASTQSVPWFTVNGALFFAAYNGRMTGSQPQITLYLTGVGNNDGHGNPVDLFYPPQNFFLKAKSGATDISFSYTNAGTQDIPTLLNNLATAAAGAGWIVVGTDTNSLTIYYPTGTVTLQSSFINGLAAAPTFPYQYPQLAHFPQSAYQYGAIYRDGGGRTNGTISNVTAQITTLPAGNGFVVTLITLIPASAPPAWARYWHPVRTDTLTYNKYTDWVTDAAYANTIGQRQFAYFGIGNMTFYNTQLTATEGVVSYGFAAGDRIRITGRYNSSLVFTALNLEYAILGVVVNPVVNGVTKEGTFVQIAYPAADINANFAFPGGNDTDFQNYRITLLSYKAQNPVGQNVFYEVGETFGIGNPGTPGVFHMGNVADNTAQLTDGDCFIRSRVVPLINSYTVATGSYNQGSPYGTVWVNPGAEGVPVVDNGIWKIRGDVNKVAGLAANQYPSFGDDNMTIQNESASAFSVRIRWTVNVTDTTDPNGQWQMFFKVVPPSNVPIIITVLDLQTGLKVGVQNTYTIDTTFSMPAGSKMWLVNFAKNQMFVSGGPLLIDIIRSAPIVVFDRSYSDIYNLRVNSDNRPSVIDTTAKQTFFPTLFRFSEPYVPGSTVNNTNRFFDGNKDFYDRAYGQVVRMILWQRRLRIAQERKWGEVGVYSKFVKNNSGSSDLIVSDVIIEPNNVEYFDQDFGIGNQPRGLAINDYQIWFFDPVRGAICRLSLDGVKQISEEFMAQSFAGSLSPAYLNNYAYPFGGNAVVLGAYNFCKDRYAETMLCFQGGTLGGQSIPSQSLVFIEKTNAFATYFRFAPDEIVCAENQLISFSQGQLYLHNDTSEDRTYYGTPISPALDLIFNDQVVIKKTMDALSYQAFKNKIWTAATIGDVMTSFINPETGLQQISNLVAEDFRIQEGQADAALVRDANSLKGLNDGDYLKGYWTRVLLTAPDNGFNALFAPLLRWDPSPKTP